MFVRRQSFSKLTKYEFLFLAEHLVKCNNIKTLLKVVLSFNWIQIKTNLFSNPNLVINDINLLGDQISEEISIIKNTLELSSHIITSDKKQLSIQLLSRLLPHKNPIIRSFLKEIVDSQGGAWLYPIKTTLTAPSIGLHQTLVGHSAHVTCLIANHNCTNVISASDDKTIKIWDLKTFVCLMTLQGHSDKINSLIIHPIYNHIISASNDRTLKIWDLNNGVCLKTLSGHKREITSITIHPNGHYVISASHDQTIRLWDLKKGCCIRKLKGHKGSIRCITIHPNSFWAVSVAYDQTLKIWDLETGVCIKTILLPLKKPNFVILHPDGRRAIIAFDNFSISKEINEILSVWDLETNKHLISIEGRATIVTNATVLPNNQHVIFSSTGGKINVLDLETGEFKLKFQDSFYVYSFLIYNSGENIITGDSDNRLRIWDLDCMKKQSETDSHKDIVSSITFHKDGRRAITASFDYTLKLWDFQNGECLKTITAYRSIKSIVRFKVVVALHSDGHRAFIGGGDHTIKIWDIDTDTCLQTLEGYKRNVTSITLHQDNHRIITASRDKTMKIWDIAKSVFIRH